MKKLFLISIAIVITLSAAYGQSGEDVLRPRGMALPSDSEMPQNVMQESPWAIGVEAGINYNMYSRDLTWEPAIQNSFFGTYDEGSGIAPFFGAFIDYSIDDMLGVQVKLQYDIKNFSGDGDAQQDCAIYDDFTGEIIQWTLADINNEWDSELAVFNIELLARINFTPELLFMLGPSFQFPLGDMTTSNTQSVVGDGECYYLFDQDGNLLDEPTKSIDGEVESEVLTRVGLSAILGYKFMIDEKISIVPQLGYQFMPTNLIDDETFNDGSQFENTGIISELTAENAQLHSLRFSVALWFDL